MIKNKFHIGQRIVMNEDSEKLYPLIFTIYDVYSTENGETHYKYSYEEYGYDHFCEGTVEFVENRFQKYIHKGIKPKV